MVRFFTALLMLALVVVRATPHASDYFKITVVDEETGRGVPLVELRTTNAARYYTDSNGIVAFYEPGLMDQTVYFHVKSHGYEFPKDGFGYRGKALPVTRGGRALLKIKRLNLAERLYRITGAGIYRDSLLVKHPVPIRHPALNGRVMGQDTVIVTPYRGKLYWFWGDTSQPAYPLGNFAVAGATSEWPDRGGLDPSVGVDLTYFVDEKGFAKKMCPLPGPGLVWIEGLMTVTNEQGQERLLATYVRPRRTPETSEKGLVIFNDSTQVFEPLVQFPGPADHRSAHPFRARVNGTEYYYYYPNLRLRADLKHISDPTTWEAFTCLVAGRRFDKSSPQLDRRTDGRLVYDWKANTAPTGFDEERDLIATKKIKLEEAVFRLHDVVTGATVRAGFGSLFWNEFRRRWILIAQENVGSAWYAEADTPVGPWAYGRKIVSHDQYTFYNLTQHPFFDRDGGRLIYFEGTYTNTFSGNPDPTPRYDYNQVMYRLALDDAQLALPSPVYRVKLANGTWRYLLREGVEAQDAWERIEEVAFFAVPPDRRQDGLLPIFASTDDRGGEILLPRDRLDKKQGAAQPLFYAQPVTPPVAAPENISGKWQCTAKTLDQSDWAFTLDLKLEGERVTGRSEQDDWTLTKGRFKDGALELELKEDQTVYVLTARLQQGKLSGEWRQTITDDRGTWRGERADLTEPPVSSAVVALYEYRRRDGRARLYTTDAGLTDPALQRSAEPIGRVWRNPRPALVLDRRVKPVPIKRN
jgi:hypothetical protein